MPLRPTMPRHPDRRRAASAVGGLVLSGLMAAGPAFAVSIELKDVASDRLERQRAANEGSLPLAGTPDLARLKDRLEEKGVKPGAPILLRAFKSESEFEVWLGKPDGSYVLFATYPVCHWSGTLGPKLREGDKQTPEGFYTVTRSQMRHVGRWPRSLNLGFPNVFDQAQARNGSHILVHGGCSSVGCFAMTNAVIEEIYGLTEAAVAAGQTYVPVHVFPFRMTSENLASQKGSPWHGFWANLKEGYDFVEANHRPPRVAVCEGRYRFIDPAPKEGADPGPLAACGETLAALQALEQLSPPVLSRLSSQLNPSVPAPRALLAHLDPQRGAKAARHPGEGLRQALAATRPSPEASSSRSSTQPPTCSTRRASCRHYLAGKVRAEHVHARSRHAAR